MPSLSKSKFVVEKDNKNSSNKNNGSSSKNNNNNRNHHHHLSPLSTPGGGGAASVTSSAAASLDTSRMTTASLPHPATAVRPRWSSPSASASVASSVSSSASLPPPPPPPPPLDRATTSSTTTSVLVHKTTPSLSQYATKSITKHYEINSQILAAFESSYDARRYHVAYAMGMQFVETALLEIPKHGYFYSPRHERERMQSSLDAVRVATLLQEIQTQDQIRIQDYEKMQKLKALAVEQVERASEDQYEAQRAVAEREIRSATTTTSSSTANKPGPGPGPGPAGAYSSSFRQQQQQQARSSSTSSIYNDKKNSSSKRSFKNLLFGRRSNSNNKTSSSSSGSGRNFDTNAGGAGGGGDNNTTGTTDSADSWIVLDDWMCPESLTNVLCPQTAGGAASSTNSSSSVGSMTQQQQQVFTLPLPPPPPPPPPPVELLEPAVVAAQKAPTSPSRKQRVKSTKTNTSTSTEQREAALSNMVMPTLAMGVPLEQQRSRTAPPGGRTRKPPDAAAAHLDDDQYQGDQEYANNNNNNITETQPPRLERHQDPHGIGPAGGGGGGGGGSVIMNNYAGGGAQYRETIDSNLYNNNNKDQTIISQDWHMVNGNGNGGQDAPGGIMIPRARQHSADEILLERALYLSGLEIAPAPLAIIPAAAAGGAAAVTACAYPPQQQQHQQYGSIPEDEIMSPPAGVTTDAADIAAIMSTTKMSSITNKRLELATLKQLYHEDFDQLRREGRLRVAFADTYQGRLSDSTNGCTVIAPLLCMHHLLEDDGGCGNGMLLPDPGLPDSGIIQVIDIETPAILNELRTSLGLSEQAFLIPADVHDYLIENGQLHQSQFVNVVGGNILDESHLQNLFQALEEENVAQQSSSSNNGGRQSKLAATLFFHEHVVAIIKLRREPADDSSVKSSSSSSSPMIPVSLAPRSPATTPTRPGNKKANKKSEFWYDLIDSLPLKDTLTRVDESDVEFSRRLGLSDSEEELSQAFLPMTARIRCLDAESMRMCIRWYACSKFTAENCQFIDTYEWDDAQSDFDPRVFQAYIWGSA